MDGQKCIFIFFLIFTDDKSGGHANRQTYIPFYYYIRYENLNKPAVGNGINAGYPLLRSDAQTPSFFKLDIK